MCVAILIEGASPTDYELLQMEAANPHGAGLAWPEGNVLRYRKGLEVSEVSELLATVPRPALLHFRWATHGPRVPHLTHPFPISKVNPTRPLHDHALEGTAEAVLIHNGVWTDYERYVPNVYRRFMRSLSDTQVAAYRAAFDEGVLEHVRWSTAVGRAAGGGRMDVTLRGDWEEHGGNLYSNLLWQYSSHGYGTAWREPVTAIGRPYVQPSHTAYEDTQPLGMVHSRRDDIVEWFKEYDASQEALKAQKRTSK